MKRKLLKPVYLLCSLLLASLSSTGQHHIMGVVLEETGKGTFAPLPGAVVYWLGTSHGTTTDTNGVFHLAPDTTTNRLVITYAGYTPDTIAVTGQQQVRVILATSRVLNEVKVTDKQSTLFYSSLDPIKMQRITEKELFKAACCNLSESFETNPSVDIAVSDAVTGIRQIQMLGLSGNYTQITSENIGLTRGLASQYGLTFIPGPWIEGMQLSKGTGSVANGYESITGQINVELKKPEKAERLYLNAYQNNMGRSELNLVSALPVGKKWHTALMAHGNQVWLKNDFNRDGFLDIPLGSQVNILNRWKFDNGKGLMAQFGVRGLRDRKVSGQTGFEPSLHKNDTLVYGTAINVDRLEGWSKIGYVFPEKKYKSMGLILSAVDHRQDAYFGTRSYQGKQQTLSGNFIFQSILGSTLHKYRVGMSAMYDAYDETFENIRYQRTERTAGAFAEYTWSPSNKFDVVAGVRGDVHNLFGLFFNPRLHVRYAPDEKTTLRLAYGKGTRVANIFTENMGYWVSSRMLVLQNTPPVKEYNGTYNGFLMPEVAWNGGVNLTREFRLNYRNGTIHLDYYRTDFLRQVVTDLDYSAHEVHIYNLSDNGKKSFSNSIQAEINYEPMRRFEVRMAYRWLDVKTRYLNGLLERPFVSKHRAFLNLAYETKSKWKFDLTVNWNGPKRLPSAADSPDEFRLPAYSPAYTIVNAQISKSFGKTLDAYVGTENLFDYRQKRLILGADQPFGPHFDASMVWGPVVGRMVYAGIRYKLK